MPGKTEVAFICTHNACRSQAAEAFARASGAEGLSFSSAGSHPASEVDPDARRVLRERYGLDLSGCAPKWISEIPHPDYAVSMGCGVACPFAGRPFDEDWGLADPTGLGDEEYVKVFDEIRRRVAMLIGKLSSSES
ncbi:MAG: arsenate reductase ArsC [Aeromonadales bacterium]|nr:arsenate reductase ArsC [Aeromonadales bacterium]MDY2890455.1 hypothetical protein [Succinivibrio sp.]